MNSKTPSRIANWTDISANRDRTMMLGKYEAENETREVVVEFKKNHWTTTVTQSVDTVIYAGKSRLSAIHIAELYLYRGDDFWKGVKKIFNFPDQKDD